MFMEDVVESAHGRDSAAARSRVINQDTRRTTSVRIRRAASSNFNAQNPIISVGREMRHKQWEIQRNSAIAGVAVGGGMATVAYFTGIGALVVAASPARSSVVSLA